MTSLLIDWQDGLQRSSILHSVSIGQEKPAHGSLLHIAPLAGVFAGAADERARVDAGGVAAGVDVAVEPVGAVRHGALVGHAQAGGRVLRHVAAEAARTGELAARADVDAVALVAHEA